MYTEQDTEARGLVLSCIMEAEFHILSRANAANEWDSVVICAT